MMAVQEKDMPYFSKSLKNWGDVRTADFGIAVMVIVPVLGLIMTGEIGLDFVRDSRNFMVI